MFKIKFFPEWPLTDPNIRVTNPNIRVTDPNIRGTIPNIRVNKQNIWMFKMAIKSRCSFRNITTFTAIYSH